MSDPTRDDPKPAPEEVDLLRRRLLLAGGYAAPAVLASFFLGQQAFGQGLCPPYVNQCDPFRACVPGRCSPLVAPCPPTGGG
ncbi:MAG: hypothetical protein AB7N76_21335 [Planctomycetota bacterium]